MKINLENIVSVLGLIVLIIIGLLAFALGVCLFIFGIQNIMDNIFVGLMAMLCGGFIFLLIICFIAENI